MDSTVLLLAKNIGDFISPLGYFGCHHLPIYYNISRDGPIFRHVVKEIYCRHLFQICSLKYWQNHNKLIEYLLIDYTFAIARANVPAIHQMIEEVPITVMGPLGKCLNQEEYGRTVD